MPVLRLNRRKRRPAGPPYRSGDRQFHFRAGALLAPDLQLSANRLGSQRPAQLALKLVF
jgi:hypothetical protein